LSGNIPVIPGIKTLICSQNQLSGTIPVPPKEPGTKTLICSHNRLS
jgi:hypothetical protein